MIVKPLINQQAKSVVIKKRRSKRVEIDAKSYWGIIWMKMRSGRWVSKRRDRDRLMKTGLISNKISLKLPRQAHN
jgi:hypothetical protein